MNPPFRCGGVQLTSTGHVNVVMHSSGQVFIPVPVGSNYAKEEEECEFTLQPRETGPRSLRAGIISVLLTWHSPCICAFGAASMYSPGLAARAPPLSAVCSTRTLITLLTSVRRVGLMKLELRSILRSKKAEATSEQLSHPASLMSRETWR